MSVRKQRRRPGERLTYRMASHGAAQLMLKGVRCVAVSQGKKHAIQLADGTLIETREAFAELYAANRAGKPPAPEQLYPRGPL